MANPVAAPNSWFISDTQGFLEAELLLGNDSDPDGDALTVTAVINPTNGAVSLTAGVINFTPVAGATTASFDYTVDDGNGGTATATVSIGIVVTDGGSDTVIVPISTDFSYVNGRDGSDTITGGDGRDTLIGGVRSDLLDGGDGNDYLVSGHGVRDTLLGGDGDDILKISERDSVGEAFGGPGNDTMSGPGLLDGGPGVDVMHGDSHRTHFVVDNPDDVITGIGREVSSTALTYTLKAGTGVHVLRLLDGAVDGIGAPNTNRIFGNDADNMLAGGRGRDTLDGAGGDDYLYGEINKDLLNGREGHDHLFGGSNNDVLVGGLDADTLTGGGFADTFRYLTSAESGAGAALRDVITDFIRGQGDRIDLFGVDADTGTGGDQAFSFIADAAFSGAAGELRWEDVGSDRLVQGDTDGDGTADLEILLQGKAGTTLLAGDFVL